MVRDYNIVCFVTRFVIINLSVRLNNINIRYYTYEVELVLFFVYTPIYFRKTQPSFHFDFLSIEGNKSSHISITYIL